jgi:hypothetical protein
MIELSFTTKYQIDPATFADYTFLPTNDGRFVFKAQVAQIGVPYLQCLGGQAENNQRIPITLYFDPAELGMTLEEINAMPVAQWNSAPFRSQVMTKLAAWLGGPDAQAAYAAQFPNASWAQ